MNGNTNINGRNLDFVINADTAYQKQYLEILLCHYVMLNVLKGFPLRCRIKKHTTLENNVW